MEPIAHSDWLSGGGIDCAVLGADGGVTPRVALSSCEEQAVDLDIPSVVDRVRGGCVGRWRLAESFGEHLLALAFHVGRLEEARYERWIALRRGLLEET